MKIRFEVIAALCAFAIGFVMPAILQAQESKPQLPFELQVILSEYKKKRAEGLTALYRRSIESLREAQAPFLRDGKLKESAAIENKIKELEKRIADLASGKITPRAGKSANDPTPASEGLVGTEWTGDHPTRPGSITFKFLDKEKVRFTHDAYRLDWQWEETEKGVLELWNQYSGKGRGWRMTVNANGKEAKLLVRSENGQGTLKLSR